MQTIGITGSFGTGKTTVARLFAKLGARVIDADELSHKVIKKRSPGYKKVFSGFGKGILNARGEVNRKKLARVVFNNLSALIKLCKIVHPEVIREIKKQIKIAKRKQQLIIVDAPLLIEAGLGRMMDKLVVVVASQEQQFKRLQRKTGLGRTEILKRIKAQLPLKKKLQLADFVVDNSGSLTYTKKQVKRIWQEIGGKK